MEIAVYSPLTDATAKSRLAYVLDWLLKERLGLDYSLTFSLENAAAAQRCIAYGAAIPGSIHVPCVQADSAAWLSAGIIEADPGTATWQGMPVFFACDNGGTVPFDIFSAIFFLLTRYEEYYAFTPDRHGRYPATESVLYRNGWLERPVVDEWVDAFRQLLGQHWGIQISGSAFRYLPTYDIDIAYSHTYKGMKRIMGAYIRAVLRGDMQQIAERIQVLKKKVKDPYDSFAWLHGLHLEAHMRPVYFILCALRTTDFDKNIHPHHPAMMRVIKQLARDGDIGIHPSYFSDTGGILGKELKALEQISDQRVLISRQHYIRLHVPATFRLLLANGIEQDFSMGYGAHLGFRAGTGSSFLWYDLQRETTTALRVHPFCFMDTTCHFELRLTTEQSFERLAAMTSILQRTGSALITIFHNFSLGTDKQWTGWSDCYRKYLLNFRG